ncbi:MAG: ribonuclease P protein subunit [Thaumarchaeota archaeon]|nr:MAG: ribonuclease P protein subunit [Nitrososphaerota archaeon]TLY08344.1 MAG: ribonuclease P protein subunit [Nitrososphaerota archaeon]
MITTENISFHELIGLNVEIVESTNKQIVGFAGKIIDETKSMFTLSVRNRVKKVPKEIAYWKFTLNGKTIILKGIELTKRPYERVGMKP